MAMQGNCRSAMACGTAREWEQVPGFVSSSGPRNGRKRGICWRTVRPINPFRLGYVGSYPRSLTVQAPTLCLSSSTVPASIAFRNSSMKLA